MKIAIAQINPILGDFAGNKKSILDNIEKARGKAELIVFPEMCVTGYPPKDLLFDNGFIAESMNTIKDIAKKTKGISAIIGFASKDEKLHNSAAVIKDGRIMGIQHKSLLPSYDVFNEERYFGPAKEHHIFSIGMKVGIMICRDLWDREYSIKPAEILAGKGAEIIIVISASPYWHGKGDERKLQLKKKARKFGIPFVYVNIIGSEDGLVFDGESLAYNSKGELIAEARKFGEDFIIFDTESEKINARKENLEKNTYDAIVLALKDYFRKNGAKTAHIGLSGGIDSSVAACIASDALGKKNVTGVFMPSEYTSRESRNYAQKLAKNLGIGYIEMPIGKLFSVFKEEIGEHIKKNKQVTQENIQARIRGNILMALSNSEGSLVITTGNKSELAMGYCTMYGDTAGSFAVLSDLYKTDVYNIARYITRYSEIIPKGTIEREPSAELRPNQKDSDELPKYFVLDPILKEHIENGKGGKEIIKMGFKKEVVDFVLGKVKDTEYKRKQLPPGVKVTKKAFGSGRQMPIASRYKG
ncbi:NAD+ synthase [Candidatus Woesearchaeota archaeon]|nr:NAD+ synthase [Candidatus Woesearchaeota archaeon]